MGKEIRSRGFGRYRPSESKTLGGVERLARSLSATTRVTGDVLPLRASECTLELLRDDPYSEDHAPRDPIAPNDVSLIEWTYVGRLASEVEPLAEVAILELVRDDDLNGESVDPASTSRIFRFLGGWRRLWSDIA